VPLILLYGQEVSYEVSREFASQPDQRSVPEYPFGKRNGPFNRPSQRQYEEKANKLALATVLTLAVSLSGVRITNIKVPFVETTISIDRKSMGIVVAVVAAYFLILFALQAILELQTRSFLSDQFFLFWKELFDESL
jgi:hypothetical protein